MAFAVTREITSAGHQTAFKARGQGLRLNRFPCDVFVCTKLTGDTTGSIDLSKIRAVQKVEVYNVTSGAWDTGVTWTVTDADTIALAGLVAGTSLVIFVSGLRIA